MSPDDLLCANCELILDLNQLPDRPNESADFSVVRRMLEVPQRGVPSERPSGPVEPVGLGDDGGDGPTRVFSVARSTGIPLVVASLTKKALSLSELEAFVVSLIDGERDVPALAKKARIGELEMSVVLQALNDKQVVDFADEALSAVEPAAEPEPPAAASITADEEPEPATVSMPPLRDREPAAGGPRTAPTERLEPVPRALLDEGASQRVPDPAPTPPPEQPLPPPRRAAPKPLKARRTLAAPSSSEASPLPPS
ncbi:MAG: hypothetical protein IAE78_07635, partial [Myxococcus sp.]|nr:hypothetical protein [Myxococcus sp.]